MYSIEELARDIGVSKRYLTRLSTNSDKCYYTYYLRKKGGSKRIIDAPNKELKSIQSWILRNILDNIKIHVRSHGFVKRKSIKTNAKSHLGKKYILCLDIKDFFPSIPYESVLKVFSKRYKSTSVAKCLAALCTYNGYLPQGAVTSPALSNIVFKIVDSQITKLCNDSGIRYTRYADDLTFSCNDMTCLKNLINPMKSILEKYNFNLNKKKTRYYSEKGRMLVTGLLLNTGNLTIGRGKKRILRSMIYNYFVKKDKDININKIIGHLSFLRDIEPYTYEKFLRYCNSLKK
jgi:RNA-directed DNA polymerase